jgi:NodT family efflux transporter outer membrane factor (OMF) lipoprotein
LMRCVMNKVLSLFPVVVFSLAACAYTPKNGKIAEQTLAQMPAPGQWSQDAIAEAVGGHWLEAFNDPALDMLVGEALLSNRDIVLAAQNVARAKALLGQSRAALLPALNLTASANEQGALGGGTASRSSLRAGVGASWEADIWGKLSAGKASSAADLVAAQARLKAAQLLLAAQTARAYFLAIEAKLQVELSASTLKAQEGTLRIVKARKRLGFSARQDLVLALSDVASAKDNLLAAQNAHRNALRALQVLLWRYPDAAISLTYTLPEKPEPVPADTPTALLERRPDIVAAKADVISAFALSARAKADRWPSLNFSGDLNAAGQNLRTLFDGPNMALNLGARLASPLFDGGLRKQRIAAAKATQRQSLARYGQSVLNAYAEVEGGLDRWRTLRKRGGYLLEAEQAANETLRLAELRYSAGQSDLLDVLTLRQRAFSASRARLANQRARLDARLDLYLALGGDF